MKKARQFSEETLQIAKKRREVKGKGESERYTPNECRVPKNSKEIEENKEIEKNNRMGKTRDLFKNISDTKGTLHAKIGKIKDINGMDQQ